ncbi:MAG: acetate--CoA ligase alpha subunit [Candidatus Bathyarchaeia archaeon]
MLEALFNPSSVAVIGASRTPGKVGHEVLKNIVESGYRGGVYPINPVAHTILGHKCYPDTLSIPGAADLGIVTVPAPMVPRVAEEAGKGGVKVLVIISAGFKETGMEGSRLESEVMAIFRRYGVRVLGPNCLGVIDTYTPLNASFAAETPLRGEIAFISQSGALCTAVLDWSLGEGVGFSKFVSLGNRADIDEADLMLAVAEDGETRVILLYLEGVGNGAKFLDVARSVTRKKPVIVLKSGITEAGARAVSSHTGSLTGSDLAYDIALRQAGVLRVRTAEELFDLAEAFSTQPIPEGPNLVIVTNAGGPGILAADACEKHGLRMAPISAEVGEKLRSRLPAAAGFYNPVDVLGDAKAERYRFALETVLGSPDVNNAIVILTPQAMTELEETARVVVEVRGRFPNKPVVASFLGGVRMEDAIKVLKEGGIPNYPFPERGVQSLSSLVSYGEYLKSPPSKPTPIYDVDSEKVASVFRRIREEGRTALTGVEAMEVARAYRVSIPSLGLARTREEAVETASEIGYPVVMKVESPQILHKTDIGGVKLNLLSAEEVESAFTEILEGARRYVPKAVVHGVNVQRMMPRGREMSVGMNRDVTFGPLIMFGLGGIYVNFLRDVSFRLAPLTREDALEMIKETRAYTLLRGIRGEARSDIEAIVDVLLRVSQLVTDFDEVEEVDINPLFVYEAGKGCVAIDIKIVLKHDV